MFGYVRPRCDKLTQAELDAYQAAYCGLCRTLGKQYGFPARFLVNYDMTFLWMLQASLRETEKTTRCRCPARVCGSMQCFRDSEGYENAAACTVILCWEKLRDDVRDESFFRGLPSRLLSRVFRRAYRKAARRLPDFAALTEKQLEALRKLEAENCASIDAVSDAFARIVSVCATESSDPAVRRPMEELLYQTGRFLYLADALDDLKKDCQRKRYNPLRFRFSPEDGKLAQEDLDYLTQLTDSSVNLAGSALALLPLRSFGSLMENVIYLGLPSVFEAVKAGKFQSRARIRFSSGRERKAGGRHARREK